MKGLILPLQTNLKKIMSEIKNILSNIKNDLYFGTNNEKTESQFFRSSILHFAISLEIGEGHYKDNPVSFETICSNIPKKIGSRSSIQNILNDAVYRGHFVKVINNKDKRIKQYLYSDKYSKMIFNWLEFQRNTLNGSKFYKK